MGFPFRLLTPQGIALEGEATSVEVPTVDGPMAILPGYTNIIASLSKAGVLKAEIDGKTRYFAIFGGVVENSHDHGCLVCVEEANDGYEIDMARAIASRDRALDRIEKSDPDLDIHRARASLARALARIDVKNLDEGKAVKY